MFGRYNADWFNESASGSRFSKIIGGVLAPFALGIWGAVAIITQQAVLRGHRQRMNVFGTDAILFGVALICLGLFLHVHYVWTVSERLYRWAEVLKILIALIGVSAFIIMFFRIIFRG